MAEQYEIFERWVEKVKPDSERGVAAVVPIKNLDTLETLVVRAKISGSEESLPGGIPLRVVNDLGEKRGSAFIEIEEVLDEEALTVSAD